MVGQLTDTPMAPLCSVDAFGGFMLRELSFCTFSLFLTIGIASAASVRETKGNLYFFGDDGTARQLTSFGSDSHPTLSPDGRIIAFVRLRSVTFSGGDAEATNELWTIASTGNNPALILKAHPSPKVEDALENFTGLTFSLDGGSIYFMTPTWATSSAIQIVNLKSKKSRFVTAGNSLFLVPRGKYVGHLIVSKHKYFAAGGSYDYFWLVSPQGKELALVSEREDAIPEFLRLNE